jgi:osmoprotectant transport system substrate-binding protein
VALALLASACGTQPASSPAAKGNITVASFDFTESLTIANLYAQALQDAGYKITLKRNLGAREIVEPAIEKGEIDLYPGYAATDLEFVNKGKGEATPDAQATAAKLRTYLEPKGVKVLEPAPAVDQNTFVVTGATATRYNLKKLSDLVPSVAGQLILGGPPECPSRPFCAKGLKDKYGIVFKDFKPYVGAGGPLVKAALERGDVQIALLFSSDGAIKAKGWVPLEDDKHLQNADNVVPIIRAAVAKADVVTLLNKISAKLTTDELVGLNKQTDIDKQDPDVVAKNWLVTNGFLKK